MIDSSAAITFATRHRVVADRILNQCDDADLRQLASDLLTLYAFAARRLHTELGWMAIVPALHEVAEHSSDPNERHAAAMILAHQMMAVGVDNDLREFGYAAAEQRYAIVNATERTLGVITAIPLVWQGILPYLTTSAGVDLLEHFSTELG
jgi:hypothetical protein